MVSLKEYVKFRENDSRPGFVKAEELAIGFFKAEKLDSDSGDIYVI